MSTTVRKIITDSINARGLSEYLGHAEPVIADVEAAAENVVASLVVSASVKGISESEVEAALIEAGLVERPAPEPTPDFSVTSEGEGDTSLYALVERLNASVERLEAAARRHGVSV